MVNGGHWARDNAVQAGIASGPSPDKDKERKVVIKKSARKQSRRPGARERRAAREIRSMLAALDFKWASESFALDAFEYINRRFGSKSLAHWNVDINHRDGSKLHFVGAFLVEYDGWLGCFTQRHGFHIYHTSDLKRYDCSVARKGR